jgi:hypothetical protein
MKIITIVILLLGAFRCSASIEIINESLSNPNSNVLFRGLYNIISIDGLSDTTGIEVLISHGSIKKEFEKYIINIQNNEPDTLSLYQHKKLLIKKIFICKNLPELKVSLGGLMDSVLSVDEIISHPQLKIELPEIASTNYSIRSFDLYFICDKKNIKKYLKANKIDGLRYSKKKFSKGKVELTLGYKSMNDTTMIEDPMTGAIKVIVTIRKVNSRNVKVSAGTNGNNLTFYHLETIKNLIANDQLVFESVKVGCPDCSIRSLEPITITIK